MQGVHSTKHLQHPTQELAIRVFILFTLLHELQDQGIQLEI